MKQYTIGLITGALLAVSAMMFMGNAAYYDIDDDTRLEIGNQLGLQGIFVGSVTGESSIFLVDSHLNIKLVDIETGRIIWSATAKDPRFTTLSLDVRTSITHTVRNALNILKNDLNKLRR